MRVAKVPTGQARSIVHAVDRVHGEALEQPLLDHDPAAAEPFLRRLKDEMHLAGEISAFGEIARRPEQHRGMAVVTAGVHLAWNRRAMRGPRRLLDVERVKVGAQPIARWPGRRPRTVPTTPVLARPSATSIPQARSLSATIPAVRVSSNAVSGWRWMSRRIAISSGS